MKERIQIFLSIEFVVATLALFINDMFLKEHYPGLLTGKLSDVAGLFIFPLFIYALVGRAKLLVFLFSAIAFILWKSPLSSALIATWNNNFPMQIGRTIDYSDLLALCVLPLAYYFKPSRFISNQNLAFKYGFATFVLFCIVGSEITEFRFKNKVAGQNPYELIGHYELFIPDSNAYDIDTITIERIRKSNYLISSNDHDTIYWGEIKKKKGDYFLNQLDEETGYWKISSFRIEKDSIYDFYSAAWGINVTPVELDFFDDYEENEKEGLITYFINNSKKETLDAFSTALDKTNGIYFREIIAQEDTIKVQTLSTLSQKSGKIESFEDLKIYPIPVSSNLTIEFSSGPNSTIQLFNLAGQLIKQEKMNDREMIWDLNGLKAGTYILELTTSDGQSVTKKFIKE